MRKFLNYLGPIFFILVIVAISGCTSSDSNSSSSNYLDPVNGSNADSYKANATTIPLANLLKSAESNKGQKVKVTGQIFQITENSDGTTDILLNTPETTSYNDRVYITYKGKLPYVKGDYIIAYGEVGGSYSYESQEGYKITIPLIKAVIIEKQ